MGKKRLYVSNRHDQGCSIPKYYRAVRLEKPERRDVGWVGVNDAEVEQFASGLQAPEGLWRISATDSRKACSSD